MIQKSVTFASRFIPCIDLNLNRIINFKMNSAKSFREYYEVSFFDGRDNAEAQKLADEFFTTFIHNTTQKIELLESYLSKGDIDLFYDSITELKYLIEFSDNLSRYWHLIRGYSGALSKLKAEMTVKGAKNLYAYYYSKYGDRRFLRDEHWFEKKRWEFLDEMQNIYFEDDLRKFFQKYEQVLSENMKIYTSFIMMFIIDLETWELPNISISHALKSNC